MKNSVVVSVILLCALSVLLALSKQPRGDVDAYLNMYQGLHTYTASPPTLIVPSLQEGDDMPINPTAHVTDAHRPNATLPTSTLSAQLSQVADAYAASMRFPPYSTPLSDQDWQKLNPRAFVSHTTPIDGEEHLRVTISLNRFINDVRNPLPVSVILTAPTLPISKVGMTIATSQSTETVPLTFISSQANVHLFEGSIPSKQLQAAGEGEHILAATLHTQSGKTYTATTLMELYESMADLKHLGDAYVDGAHLMIPAYFDVKAEGFYRMQANLMDADTGKPISHINATFVLSDMESMGLLKVHAATLKAMNAKGPYQLQDINIQRSPSWPGDVSGYGSTINDTFAVAGYELTTYSDEPYNDPNSQARLSFLHALAHSPGINH